MNEPKQPLLSGQKFGTVTTVTGQTYDGPWTFTSDGAGCLYPRFVSTSGDIIPLGAVVRAVK